jgi:hypothetical protein
MARLTTRRKKATAKVYKVANLVNPYTRNGCLFAEKIQWQPSWEPYCNLPKGCLQQFRSGEETCILADDPLRKRASVRWEDQEHVSMEAILRQFPTALTAAELYAYQQASLEKPLEKPEAFGEYSAAEKTSVYKQTSNQNFADTLLQVRPGSVVYLDAETANTTSFLQAHKQLGFRLVAVNKSSAVLSSAILHKHCQGVYAYTGTLVDCLSECTPRSLAGIFADYCGTFSGSTTTGLSPANCDLPLIFSRQLLQPGGILALVVCTRISHSKTQSIRKKNIVPFIVQLALKNGYRAELTHEFSYNSMYSIQFSCH